MLERITADNPTGPARYGHDFRYRLASGFVGPEDRVLDAACGSGYGRQFFRAETRRGRYLGLDKDVPADLTDVTGENFNIVDLTAPKVEKISWSWWDVFVGFETIEHLVDPSHYIDLAWRARKWIIMSVPIVPTKHLNPYHLHDFEPGGLQVMLEANPCWEHYQTVRQPSEFSEIVVMRNIMS